MGKQYYKIIQDKATKGSAVDILIYGVIGDSWYEESLTAKSFVSDFKKLEKEYSRINIHINSPGGSVYDGLAIASSIRNSTVDIHTYNDGLAASMASVILFAGNTSHAYLGALTLIHSPSVGVIGNKQDLLEAIDVLDEVQTSLVAYVTAKSGISAEDIESKYFDGKDHWLSADEALKENLIDFIDENATAQIPENLKNTKDLDYTKLVALFNAQPNFKRKDKEMNLKELNTKVGLPEDTTEEEFFAKLADLQSPKNKDPKNQTITDETIPAGSPATTAPVTDTNIALSSEEPDMAAQLKKMQDKLDEQAIEIEALKGTPGDSSNSTTTKGNSQIADTKDEILSISADDRTLFNNI